MTGKDITIKGEDGEFSAYLASPASGRGPGVVVIQEIFGVNAVMRAVADGFAARGYFALCPDLFWRIEPGVQITDKTDAEWKRAFALMGKFNPDTRREGHSIHHHPSARRFPAARARWARWAIAWAACSPISPPRAPTAMRAVGYYGVNIHQKLGEAKNIKKPLMLHIAEKDQFVPPPAQKEITDALKDNPLVTVYQFIRKWIMPSRARAGRITITPAPNSPMAARRHSSANI